MKVILRENVEKLGKIGDIVRVSEGYARNFLLPRKLVEIADEQNLKAMEHHKKAMDRKKDKAFQLAQDLASRLAGVSCTVSRKVGEQEKLFGSVTSGDIAQVLQKEGYGVEKRQIHLEEPIKQLGVFTVAVKVHPEVTAQLKVWVVEEK